MADDIAFTARTVLLFARGKTWDGFKRAYKGQIDEKAKAKLDKNGSKARRLIRQTEVSMAIISWTHTRTYPRI